MGKSQLDKLGALTHARRYTHTHTRPRTPHSAYVIKCAVKFALGARVHSYLSPWQLRRGDCNRTISRGSWEISLKEWALLRNGGGGETEWERERREEPSRDNESERNLLSAAMWIKYLTLSVCRMSGFWTPPLARRQYMYEWHELSNANQAKLIMMQSVM